MAHPKESTASSSPKPLNHVQDYLNKSQSRLLLKDVPTLSPPLLKRARNCIVHSFNNNDLLEFIGDRAVNLFAAVLVDKMKLNKAHHSAVRSTVCNNDTLGRISFYLRFHHHAEFNKPDADQVDEWTPFSSDRPPKVLADLFEAYVGAVYVQHGWVKLQQWLEILFVPIVKAATGDYWLSITPEQLLGTARSSRHKPSAAETRAQGKLLDYVEYKRDVLKPGGHHIINSLPPSTKFRFDQRTGRLLEPDVDRVEVAVHLINMWVCQVILQQWPEYHAVRAKAAHFFSEVTGLVTSEPIMAYLSTILRLDDFFGIVVGTAPVTSRASSPDPSSESEGRGLVHPTIWKGSTWRPPTPTQKAIMFKAAVGWSHFKDPSGTMKWGEQWLKPVVMRAHDIICMSGHRLVVPASVVSTQDDPVAALTSQLSKNLRIKDERSSWPGLELFDKDADEQAAPTDTPPTRPSKITIVLRMRSPSPGSSPAENEDPAAQLVEELSILSLSKNGVDEADEKTALSSQPQPTHRHSSNKWKPISSSPTSQSEASSASESSKDEEAATAVSSPEELAPTDEEADRSQSAASSTKATAPNPKTTDTGTFRPLQALSVNTPNTTGKPPASDLAKAQGTETKKSLVADAPAPFVPRAVRAKAKQTVRIPSSADAPARVVP
ncbi:hypothetical protein EIP91_010188 [Steccherinum ochraceum]|uniref:RNase III domain-containing protein n=1 Tax=Steccherinum ochraceum TaxID=92696 RepID=A0A4R0RM46_9APHY|nr:hypothetical protein EIP91_010188 [Steccherinum ochraceum]